MAVYDQGRAKRNAGTAPIAPKAKKTPPLKADYVPKESDAPIVKEAYAKKQAALQRDMASLQTGGNIQGLTPEELQAKKED
ncbi:hypothetical protein LJC04_02035 [Ruminococcaceae bacterium OttesenSCG-928-O06]|nr:hypothetical protein [Ruminococcaceae bacterium OttesenSCG-928-O06]